MPSPRTVALTVLAMCAFAANSLLCREALRHSDTGAAAFTAVRIASGAVTLAVLVGVRRRSPIGAGSWSAAAALAVYAGAFSFAYRDLPVATGALLLFAAVQVTMVGHALRAGERLRGTALAGAALAIAGLLALLLPGAGTPRPAPAALMLLAGAAWGVYSLLGRGQADPSLATAGNFVRATPLVLALVLAPAGASALDLRGGVLALTSGALASGLGYVLWYAALPGLPATTAALVQLSVPALTATAGAAWLGEAVSPRAALCSLAILGGIAVVLHGRSPGAPRRS